MREENLEVIYKGETISNLRLTGSYQAGIALVECQEQYLNESRDPFSETRGDHKDPFDT